MPRPHERVAYEFDAGRQGSVRFRLASHRGFPRLDIRVWVPSGGELVPTHNGLNVGAEYADQVLQGLEAVVAALGPARSRSA